MYSPENQRLSDNSIEFSLKFLTVMFINPFKSNKYIRKFNQALFAFDLFIFILLTIIVWFTDEHTIRFIAEFIWNFGLVGLISIKLTPFVVWEQQFINIIELRKHFWKIDGYAKEFDDEIYSLLKFFNVLIKVFSGSVIFVGSTALIVPFFNENGLMAIAYYTESTYIFVFLMHYYFDYMYCAFVIATTCLFLAIVSDLIIQFRVIKMTIKERNWNHKDENLKEVHRILGHYRFLQTYMKDVGAVLLSPFLGMYFCTIITNCIQSYTLLAAETDTVYNIRAISFIMAVFMQIGLYSIPTYELVCEIRDITNAWYASNWVDATDDYRKMVPFLIMQTQNIPDFKALGLVTINNLALINVIKLTMSYLTFMKNLK